MEISVEDQAFIDSLQYELYHVGFYNQNAYRKFHEGFYFEIVCHANNRWTYHAEKNNRMIFDSGISNTSYETAEMAHNTMLFKITDKYFIRRDF